MKCKEFEKNIKNFIEHKMNYATMKHFVEHQYTCSECKEELVIQFLIEEGMSRLEEGDTFDLQKELEIRIGEVEKKIQYHTQIERIGEIIEYMVMLTILLIVIFIVF